MKVIFDFEINKGYKKKMLKQFKQVKSRSLTDIVEEELRNAIINLNLKPGDKLPGELELVKSFNVSRSVVREAIGRLRSQDIVYSKKSKGLILKQPDLFSQLKAVIGLPILSSETKMELYNLRLALEIGVAPMVFLNKTDEDIANLQKIVDAEKKAPADLDLSIESDVAFHSYLYGMTYNHCIGQFQEILRSFMVENVNMFDPTRFTDGSSTHQTIIDALKQDDIDLFCKTVREHLIQSLESNCEILKNIKIN